MLSRLFSWAQRHGLRAFAAIALAALTLALACFNVSGWLAERLALLAILAACFEAIGFVFAVLTEDAVRHGRWDRALVCFVILLGAAAFNTVGGHRAWEASMGPRQDEERQHAQRDLDAHRASLQLAAARAEAEIERVPLPSPDQLTGRQAEARATWEMATAAPRQRKATAEAELLALPTVAPAPAAEFDAGLVWGFLGFLEIAKALGLWAIGMNAVVAQPASRPSRETVSGANKAEAPTRVWAGGFDASEAARRLVSMRRDRQPAGA